MEYYELTKKEQKFYREFYPSVDTLCGTIEHFSKTDESHEIYLGEMLLSKTFRAIKEMEIEILGEEVNVAELKITDDEYFENLDKLYLLREKVEEKFDDLLLANF